MKISPKYQVKSHEDYANADLLIYDQIRHKKEIDLVNFQELDVAMFPNVFSPIYFTDSYWFANQVASLAKGKKFLEIGSGTGIVSLLAAKYGAKVTCSDINPAAVENTKYNFNANNLSADIVLSDLFENITSSDFDYIFWNHPFFESLSEVNDLLLKAGFDHNYGSLKNFIDNGSRFLNKTGKLLLGTGNAARLDRIEEICNVLNVSQKLVATTTLPVHPDSELLNDYRLYELVKR